MNEIGGRQVVVKVDAAQTCYTSVAEVLKAGVELPFDVPGNGTVVGHGGVGICVNIAFLAEGDPGLNV